VIGLIQEAFDAFFQLFRRKKTTSQIVRSRERRMATLQELRERGDLSEAEYEQQRQRILDEA
jgi:uncharacterized membrane protein